MFAAKEITQAFVRAGLEAMGLDILLGAAFDLTTPAGMATLVVIKFLISNDYVLY